MEISIKIQKILNKKKRNSGTEKYNEMKDPLEVQVFKDRSEQTEERIANLNLGQWKQLSPRNKKNVGEI